VPLYIINNILGHSDSSSNKDIVVYGDENMSLDILQKTISDFLDFENIRNEITTIF